MSKPIYCLNKLQKVLCEFLDIDKQTLPSIEYSLKRAGYIGVQKGEVVEYFSNQLALANNKTQSINISTQDNKPIRLLRETLKEKLTPIYKQNIINKETNLQGIITNEETKKISSKKAVDKSLANGFNRDEHFKAAEYIKELFENAHLKQTHADYKGNPNIKAVHRFITPLKINDREANAQITLFEKMQGNNKIYTIELESLNKPDSLSASVLNTESAVNAQSLRKPHNTAIATIAKTDSDSIAQKSEGFTKSKIENSEKSTYVSELQARVLEEMNEFLLKNKAYNPQNLTLKSAEDFLEFMNGWRSTEKEPLSMKHLQDYEKFKDEIALYINNTTFHELATKLFYALRGIDPKLDPFDDASLMYQLKEVRNLNDKAFFKKNLGKRYDETKIQSYTKRLSDIRTKLEQQLNIHPLKEFGTNYAEFYRDGKGAIEKLLSEKQGQVSGVFYRKDLGDIDLVWGDSKFGLEHILEQRTKQWGKQKAFDFVKNDLERIINEGKIHRYIDNKIELITDKEILVLGKNGENNFIITAFKDRRSAKKMQELENAQTLDDVNFTSKSVSEQNKTDDILLQNQQGIIPQKEKILGEAKANDLAEFDNLPQFKGLDYARVYKDEAVFIDTSRMGKTRFRVAGLIFDNLNEAKRFIDEINTPLNAEQRQDTQILLSQRVFKDNRDEWIINNEGAFSNKNLDEMELDRDLRFEVDRVYTDEEKEFYKVLLEKKAEKVGIDLFKPLPPRFDIYSAQFEALNKKLIESGIEPFGISFRIEGSAEKNKGQNAINLLLEARLGQVKGAFYRKDLQKLSGVGEIDLVWGEVKPDKKGFGLAHILDKHPDFDVNLIPQIVENGKLEKRVARENAYNIAYENYKLGVNSGFNGKDTQNKWIVTAFDESEKIAKTARTNDFTEEVGNLSKNSEYSIAQNEPKVQELKGENEVPKEQNLPSEPSLKERLERVDEAQKRAILIEELEKRSQQLKLEKDLLEKELIEFNKNNFDDFELEQTLSFLRGNLKQAQKYLNSNSILALRNDETGKESAKVWLKYHLANKIRKIRDNESKTSVKLEILQRVYDLVPDTDEYTRKRFIKSAQDFLSKDYDKEVKERSITYHLHISEDYAKVKALFESANPDKEQRELFERVLPVAKDLGVEVKQAINNELISKDSAGVYYLGSNSARIKNNRINQLKGKVLLHELIHSVTSRALYAYDSGKKELLMPNQIRAIENIQSLFKQVSGDLEKLGFDEWDDIVKKGDYGLKNPHEFLAELSNPNFREKLKKVGVFEAIIDNILRLFLKAKDIFNAKKTNAYESLKKSLYEIIDSYDDNFTKNYNEILATKNFGVNAINS